MIPWVKPVAVLRGLLVVGSRPWRLLKAARGKIVLLMLLFLFLALNGLAFLHARAFTHYGTSSDHVKHVENLAWKDKLRVFLTGLSPSRPENTRKPWFWTRYSTHTYDSTDGVTLEAWYLPTRDAKAVVAMFHGYGTAKATLLDEEKAFRTLGYSTFLVDLRGHGGSTGSATSLGYREADDVAATVAYLHELLPNTPVVLYGSSMGGAAVLRAMAEKGVTPIAAIVECPFDALLSAVKNRFRMMGVPSFPLAHLMVFWGGLQFGYNGFAHRPVDYASKVTVPTLVIGGGKDRRVTLPQLRSVYARLAGEKQLLIFDDSGHGGYVDDDEKRWKRAVRQFVDSSSASIRDHDESSGDVALAR